MVFSQPLVKLLENVLVLDSGEVVGINYVNEPVGIFYPMDQIKEKDRWINNFKWNPALRPKDEFTLTDR